MALETSVEKPAPVRAIANAISGWIDRLGPVWVEGQVTQISRRPGLATVFLTLRDSVADISVPVTCSRVLFDGLPAPLQEGASVVIHARPSYYANRGTLSLQARDIRMVGLGEAPGPAGAAPSGCWPRRACSPRSASVRCRPSPGGSAWSPRRSRRPSATSSRTPPAAGPPWPSRSPTPPCRATARPPR
ncbi:exodeoxyribonuclease VII large subunit [Nocardioides sp. W3-2-3]|nr:exodeoxyribonuclease VII large subunit [Nocardioides convexus]